MLRIYSSKGGCTFPFLGTTEENAARPDCGLLLFKMNNKLSKATTGRKDLPSQDTEEAGGTQMYVFRLCSILTYITYLKS